MMDFIEGLAMLFVDAMVWAVGWMTAQRLFGRRIMVARRGQWENRRPIWRRRG